MAHLTIRFGGRREAFVVAVQSAAGGDPGQRALDDPASWQDLEAALAFGLLDDRGQLAAVAGDIAKEVAIERVGVLDRAGRPAARAGLGPDVWVRAQRRVAAE